MDLIINNKFVQLKNLLIDGLYEKFETNLDSLSNEELIYFAYFGSSTFKSSQKKEYYYHKLIGEVIHNLVSRKAFNGTISSDRNKKVLENAFGQLANSFETAFNSGFWIDVEKFGRCLIGYPDIDDEDYVYFLGLMASSAYNRNDVKSQVEFCRLMNNRVSDSPEIWSQLAYALMLNEEYEEAQRLLDNCIEKGYHKFHVYNQLSRVVLYHEQDFDKSLEYLSYISKNIKPLTDRQNYLLYMNILSSCGLSGNLEKNDIIDEFLSHLESKDSEFKSKWIKAAECFKHLNIGLNHLGNKQYHQAINYFQKISNEKDFEGIYKFGLAITKIIYIIIEIGRIRNANEATVVLVHLTDVNIDSIYQKYIDLISIYVQLIHDSYKVLNNDSIDQLEVYKHVKINHFTVKNLFESNLMSKIFDLKYLINSYHSEYKNAILKNRFKEEMTNKFHQIIRDNDLGNDLKFLYFDDTISKEFHIIDLTIKSILLLQRSEPSFLKNFRLGKVKSLYESDFRDVIYRTFGLTYDVIVTSESLSKKGHTDLQIFSKKLGDITFEFKIWGKNDYKSVVSQILGYLTSNQHNGFIFMINSNKSSIESVYLEEVIISSSSFIQKSLRKERRSNFKYYTSNHLTTDGMKTIYHFLYNIY